MRIIKTVLMLVAVLTIGVSCFTQPQNKQEEIATKVSQADKIEVCYFHYSRRCATCNAIESVSKETVAEIDNDKVSFTSYNLDEEKGEQKGKELEVPGQALLIVVDGTKIDITTEAFMNARTQPDKLKALIEEKIDPFL